MKKKQNKTKLNVGRQDDEGTEGGMRVTGLEGISMMAMMTMGVMKMMGAAVTSYLSGTFPGPPEQHSLNIH